MKVRAEQITLGGRPLQNISLALRGDDASWAIDRLDMRAPGTTQISFTNNPKSSAQANFAGTLNITGFGVQNGNLVAFGTLVGTLTNTLTGLVTTLVQTIA